MAAKEAAVLAVVAEVTPAVAGVRSRGLAKTVDTGGGAQAGSSLSGLGASSLEVP